MTSKHWILFITSFVLLSFVKAQNKTMDSTAAAATLKTIADLCRNIDFDDPKTTELGTFYKTAAFVVYRGEDKKRAWKVFSNYKDAEDKKGVDEICTRVNQSINQDSSYTILKYFTEKESEGVWHVLVIKYIKKGVEKKVAFAFLKIEDRLGLGDIDMYYK